MERNFRSKRNFSAAEGSEGEGAERPRRSYGAKKSFGDRKPFGDRGPRRSSGDRKPFGDRGPRRSFGDRKPFGDRGDRKPFGDRDGRRPFRDRKPFGAEAGAGAEGGEERPRRSYGSRSYGSRSFGDRKPYGDRGPRRSFGDRKPFGDRGGRRSFGDRDRDRKPYGDRDRDGRRPFRERKPFDAETTAEAGAAAATGAEGGEERPRRSYGSRGFGDRGPRRSFGDRKPFGDRGGRRGFGDRDGDRKPFGDRGGRRSFGDRDRDRKPYGDRDRDGRRPFRERKPFDAETTAEAGAAAATGAEGGEERPRRSYGSRGFGDRGPRRSFGDRDRDRKPYGDRDRKPFRERKPYGAGEGEDGEGKRSFRGRGYKDEGAEKSAEGTEDHSNDEFVERDDRRIQTYTPKPRQPKAAGEDGVRLNKFIANAGISSRREADEFITAGVVSVNGQVVTEMGTKVFQNDVVKFNDEIVKGEQKVYILMNKPKDYVTTTSDPHADKTVMDLVEGKCAERVYPVGRLDRETTGVLLLTNDGELTEKLTHPSFEKKKIYQATLDKNLKKTDFDQILSGVTLDDGPAHADALSYVGDDESVIGIEIHNGKNRIVRRLFESLGYEVKKLDRVYFAGLTKKGLRRGQWRFLTEAELGILKMGSYE